MPIGLLSDTHDNVANLNAALDLFRNEGLTTLVHCGDMTSATTAEHLAGFRVICVTGNMERDAPETRQTLLSLNPHNWFGATFTGEVEGVHLAVTHGHLAGQVEELARSGQFAYVFHGHTHRRRDEVLGQTRILNPGALGGVQWQPRSICIVDFASGDTRFLKIPA